jgi:hypothetical protein
LLSTGDLTAGSVNDCVTSETFLYRNVRGRREKFQPLWELNFIILVPWKDFLDMSALRVIEIS